jgi:hypothetical protein
MTLSAMTPNAGCFAKCHVIFNVMLSVFMLSVVLLNVSTLSVVMLTVMAPSCSIDCC